METNNGFGVITGELTGYAQRTRHIATELHTLGTHRLAPVRKAAEPGFGPIGKESGFATALDHFAGALEHQVIGIGRGADELGDSVAKAAHTYRQKDDDRAKDLIEMIRGKR